MAATLPVKFIAAVPSPLHSSWFAGVTTLGVGLTVTVKLCAMPLQPLAAGVTIIVAVAGVLVPLVAVNGAMFPVPFAANPIVVLLFVQLNTVPLVEPLKFRAAEVALLQITWLAGTIALGGRLTVTTAVVIQVVDNV